MPLDASLVGIEPKQSPLITNAILTWSMNYVACAVPTYIPMEKKYFDNTNDAKPPPLHPLFVASVQEVIGAWAALYASGMSKLEVIKHSFVHYTYDAIFYDSGLAGDFLQTKVHLVGIGNRRSGGHFLTSNVTSNQKNNLISKSWWGGVVLGLNSIDSVEKYLEHPPQRPTIIVEPSNNNNIFLQSNSYDIDIPAAQAHLFDGCIRDPRKTKAPSSDINTHTNLDFALKGGLPGRTLNGMCLLSFVIGFLSHKMKQNVSIKMKNITNLDEINLTLKQVGVTFGAPVVLDLVSISVHVDIVSQTYNIMNNDIIIHFNVITNDGGKAIKNGYFIMNYDNTNSSMHSNSKL